MSKMEDLECGWKEHATGPLVEIDFGVLLYLCGKVTILTIPELMFTEASKK